MTELLAIGNIQSKYHTLSPMEKRLADYVLKHSAKVIEYTVKELALASDVSEATVVRMCQHIGFKGFWPFRMSLSKEVMGYQPKSPVDKNDNSMASILREYSETMINIANNINEEAGLKCIELLKNCDQVYLISSGNTTPIIEHMGFRLGRLGIKCTFSGVADYYMNHLNLATQNELVLAISQSGVTKSVIDGVTLAKQRNLKVIAVTAYKNSALAELADCVIESKGDFSRFDHYRNYSHLCEMAVCEAVLDMISKDERTLEKVEEKNTDMLEFLSDMKL